MMPSPDRAHWRWLANTAGVAAAGVLAWFIAPLVEVGGHAPLTTPTMRLFAVAAVLWLACGVLLAQRALSARRNRHFLDGLAHSADAEHVDTEPGEFRASEPGELAASEPGRREVAFLRQRFAQALTQLRRLHLAQAGSVAGRLSALVGRPFVHELPWYVIIGAPGAGKTTALINSGLHFPLFSGAGDHTDRAAVRESIRGVGGTRNCDWWFASEAVLIDTAGRYTTQDSDRQADGAAWLGFLDLLRRHRPRRPINGVLLTVSASDLLHATPARIAAHAGELRQRLDELRQRLAIEVPVYLLVTKTDLLPGFAEFFADLDEHARAQVWGVTLPPASDPSQWQAELDALDARLHQHMLRRLGADTAPAQRSAIHAFPQQWRALSRSALELLHAVLVAGRDTGRGDEPMLRGLYFTSATQSAAQRDVSRTKGQSFFVTRLLRDVVFAESGLAGSTARSIRQHRLIERTALAATALALLLAIGWTWRGYERQSRAVDAFAAQLPALDSALARAQASSDLTALLPALDALAAADDGGANDGSLADRWLDRREMLTTAADDSYQRLLKEAFLSRIAARLEDRLRKSAEEPAARTYETLCAYLMLFGGKHFDAAALRAYLANDWQLTLPNTVSAAERAALLRHLDQLLASGEVGAPARADAQLVATARARVQSVPLAQRAATRLQQQDANATRVPLGARGVLVRASGAALADALPQRAGLSPQRLRERTQQVLAQLTNEQTWVLGTSSATPATPALADEVERLYATDNALYWQSLLDDLRLAPTTDLAASAQLARTLAQADSPLLALLRTAARETAVGPPGVWFAALRVYTEGASPPSAKTQALLGELAAHLAAVDAAVQRKALPPASDVLRELAQEARKAPAPLNRLLSQLHASSTAQLLGALREPLSREIARELAPACARTVSQHYPFARSANDEMTRDDFTRTFGAGGLFDSFSQRYLAPYADAAHGEGAAPLRRAQTIRDAFFREGGRALGTRLEFRLLELDAAATEFTLDVDGQVLRWKRDTKQAQSIDWLTLGGSAGQSSQSGHGGRVHVQLAPSAGSGYTFNGPWALLRLLDRARVERGASPDRALVSFDIEGRKARFEVRSATAHNPLLRQDLLEPFQCPNKL
jgi:type VI secretion system protein ImpL